ncbi:hypothetical protein, partial [Roseomonas rosulenta]|uniref:hypothetical protein n=1 Tax=Roseomonas rosulenta TaxID=2748667 RepID=UPI0018DF65CB
HVNAAAAWGEARAAAEALPGLRAGAPNIEVAAGRLAPEAYLDLLRGARIALFPYDPALYRRKSSGVLWEAISLGLPVVVPEGTWLEHEARHWGAGHVAHAAHSAEAIADAFADALPRIAELQARSAEAGARYRAANGAAALIDQVAALWVRHKATAALVRRALHTPIDLQRMEAGWHRPETVDGRQVRWTAQEPVIAFDWPFDEPWEVELTLLSFFGAEQLDRCEAVAGEGPVSLSYTRIGRGARLVVQGAGPGRAQPRVLLKLRLPYTYRPANEARDLGVLVAGIRVGPVAQEAAARMVRAQDGPSARVLGTAAAGGGWPVAPALSGEVASDPATPCVLAFCFAPAGIPVLRSLALHVNAVPVPMEISAAGEEWLATATLPPALLRQGAPAAWDLVADAAAGEAPVLRRVSAAPMAGTAAPGAGPAEVRAHADPTEATAQDGVTAVPARDDLAEVAARIGLADAPSREGFADAPSRDGIGDAPSCDGACIRWDLSAGIGPQEGPFEDLGIAGGVRWVVARRACLVLEAAAEGPARLKLRYRSLLPRQALRAELNGGPETAIEATGTGLREAHELSLDVALRAGMNELALHFTGAVREPGTGRELVLLIEAATID